MASPPPPRKKGTSIISANTPGPCGTDSQWIADGDNAVRLPHHRSLFESLVRRASTRIAPEVKGKGGDVEDFEQLTKNLKDASPLEIMDKALEKFGNDIAIDFR